METLSIALQDYKLELYDGSTRRLITHAIYDAHLSPSEPPRLETWEREKKPIAEGGQGKVYVQRCSAADTIRAVKVIRHNDNTGRRRYLQELETMIRFSHQRYSRLFVRMLGWYTFRKDICIIMEYLPQGDIHTFLRQRPALEENDARTVISQILQGISVMHKAGFAHRDVKPQNILIQRSRTPSSLGSWWVKLADFGISKDVNATMTNGTGAIGTWDYMAPELINYRQGTTAVDYMAGDMWSAGATTLYLMTKLQGAHRQGFKSPEEITQRLPSGTETSPNARDFLYRALAPDPGLRLDATGGLTHPWIRDLVPSVQGSTIPETESLSSSASSESHSDSVAESEELLTLATAPTDANTPGDQTARQQLSGTPMPLHEGALNDPLSQSAKAGDPEQVLRTIDTVQSSKQDSGLVQRPWFYSPVTQDLIPQATQTAATERFQLFDQLSPSSSRSNPYPTSDDESWPAFTIPRAPKSLPSTSASSLSNTKQINHLSRKPSEPGDHNSFSATGSSQLVNLCADEHTKPGWHNSNSNDRPLVPSITPSQSQCPDSVSAPLTIREDPAAVALVKMFTPVGGVMPLAPRPGSSNEDSILDVSQQRDLLTSDGKAVLFHKTDVQKQRSAYLEAAYWGNLEVVMSSLSDGVDLETRGSGEQSALYIAASQGHEDIVRALLDADATIDGPNDTNFTPLHAAIHSKHQEIALLLIQRGANVQAVDNQGSTPLHHAIIRNLPQVVTQLQASKADVNAIGLHGLTVLHIAAMAGNDEILLQLPLEKANMEAVLPPSSWLELSFAPLPALVRSRLSPLHLAILYKHPRVVECLLDSGSHREVMAAVTSTVPSALLYCALIAGEPACFKILLRNIPYRNKKPLWVNLLAAAVRSRQTEFAYMLQDTLANYAANAEGLKLMEVPSASNTTKRCELNEELSGIWLRNTKALFSRKLHIGTPDNPKVFRIAWEALPHGAGRRFFVHTCSSAVGPSPALVAGDVPLTKVINGLFQVSPDLIKNQEREPVDVLRMGKTELGGVWFRFSSGEQSHGQSVRKREDLLPDIDESEDYEWTASTASHGHFKHYDLFQLEKRDIAEIIRSNERREPREHSGGVVAKLILNERSLRTKAFSLLMTHDGQRASTDMHNDSGRDAISSEWTLRILITALMIWFRHVHEKVSLEEKMDELVGLTAVPA